VLEPGKGPVRRKVEIGPANDTYVEIKGGVAEGDEVLLYNPLLPEAKKEGDKPGEKPEDKPAADKPASGNGAQRP
jgi:hypothetical protein